ncbi:N-methyl-L-tryptophan oxidase [Fulvivirga lutimaris]|uniref:N-methyl-L-tryptophan oxidase n=1 Tax=Fulvivirga lutimaris TaxID=1819566 RepID=UPI0012BC0816|nr:N-methyl-L-tryptophan oxidase [Fulvivirga lutimaris]MTI41817.1 N-methyl-L-tryptophan oxidase [Fulvivirga lutimaris]
MVYDVIVIGVGSMGSATCYQLAARGVKVLGIEQFGISHENGSHTGQSRIIRKAYFEHSDYVPLLHKAYDGWRHLEKKSRRQFYWPTGIVYFGAEGDTTLTSIKRSADTYDIKLDQLDLAEAKLKWPQFKTPSHYECLFEPEAGFVTPERAIQTYAEMAKELGAEIHTNERIEKWEVGSNGVTVTTNLRQYRASRIVFASGAFSEQLLDLKVKLKVTRQYLAWVKPQNNFKYDPANMPCWLLVDEGRDGAFYGFPQMPTEVGGPEGVKFGYHNPGEVYSDHEDLEVLEREKELLNDFLARYFNQVNAKLDTVKSCKYTYTPDDHFIVDLLPDMNERVVIACGFSGHGYKFSPVIGEALADLALEGGSDLPIQFLELGRF